jgi:hypothetical protein
LVVTQLIGKFLGVYGTRVFNYRVHKSCHWSLLLAIPIQSTPFLFKLTHRETPDFPSLNLLSTFRCIGHSTVILYEGLFVTAYSISSQLPSVSGDADDVKF